MNHRILKSMAAAASIAAGLAASTTGANATVNFSTFVTASDISATEGANTSVIAFNYTGTGFVGSVYFGTDNNQLFSTNLSGGNVQHYGGAIPGFSGEVVVGVGLGQAGFAKGAVYAGNGSGNQIYYVPSSGVPVLFGTTGNSENIRQIFFDPGSSFGGAMLVTTNSGRIYKFNSSGTPTLLANIGADTEGMDIAGSGFGPYAGDLLVASEGTGEIHAITPGGTVFTLDSALNTPVDVPEAETVSYVPSNLGVSGNPVEGFYVANYPVDIQKAGANEFVGLQGDAIVTSEFSGNSPVWALGYDSGTGFFSVTQVGTLPNQSEDGIFVTAERVRLVGTPEPSTWTLMLLGFVGLGFAGYRASRKTVAVSA
jgi:PEP-CTERM motif